LLGAVIRPIFNATDLAAARDRLSEAVAHLEHRLPKVSGLLEQTEDEVLPFYAFPAEHRTKIRSTNPHRSSERCCACRSRSSANACSPACTRAGSPT
jgi:transposase-like protein